MNRDLPELDIEVIKRHWAIHRAHDPNPAMAKFDARVDWLIAKVEAQAKQIRDLEFEVEAKRYVIVQQMIKITEQHHELVQNYLDERK